MDIDIFKNEIMNKRMLYVITDKLDIVELSKKNWVALPIKTSAKRIMEELEMLHGNEINIIMSHSVFLIMKPLLNITEKEWEKFNKSKLEDYNLPLDIIFFDTETKKFFQIYFTSPECFIEQFLALNVLGQ